MNYLQPITITDAMVGAGTTVPEPAPGETAWVSAASYTAGDARIRATTHRRYIALQTHTGRAALPEADPAFWEDVGPTLRWAPFDTYVSTPARATTALTYVLNPGYINALALYGLVGASLAVTIKDAPGGATIHSHASELTEPPAGWYEYLFVAPKVITKLVLSNLPIRPTAEITITLTAASGQPVALGMVVLGDLVNLVGDLARFGGTEHGSMAEPVTYSYIKTDEFGNTTIVRRHRSTNMTARIALPTEQADEALRLIQGVLDVPVAWIGTTRPGYAGLNVFGLGSARVTYQSATVSSVDLNVKGMI